MPHIEIYVWEDGKLDLDNEELYYAYERADSLDPQDLQDALTEAFHSIEQDIWYSDDPEGGGPNEPDPTAVSIDDPIGVGYLGEVVDFQAFRDFSVIVTHTFADAGVRVLNAIGQPPFQLRDESSYDRSVDDDLLPEFSD